MIISKTPFRLSFFGGGTDYPTWFEDHGGAVLSTTINKYCYLTVRHLPPFFDHRHRVVYSNIELVNKIDDIEHPVVRAVMELKGISEGVEIHHFADLPARSGLGSSSTFTVGLLNAVDALYGKMTHRQSLAREAVRVEHDILQENVGWQDQISAAFGGFNRIDFSTGGDFTLAPVVLPKHRIKELDDSVMLFFTGISRYATDIAKETIDNMGARTSQLHRMREMVDEGLEILSQKSGTIEEFGRLLDESWQLKRSLANNISSDFIDEIYNNAMAAGATGGKLMGAGGGGFMFFIVPPHRQQAVRERLADLTHVSFGFDTSGTEIMVYLPENGDPENELVSQAYLEAENR
jgi:D-glycero-alpha-D-manno-heptose-7-phosphate kinase